MRVLILAAMLTFGAASAANAARCLNPATNRMVQCQAAFGPARPGIGKTVVLSGPAARVRLGGRCGRYRCGRGVAASVVAPAPVIIAQPAAGYAPPLH